MNYIALLKGAPLTVLFAILREGGQSTTGDLVRITGYSQPTVTRSCRQLCEAGLATDSIVGWQILEGGLQMVLGENNHSTKKFLPDDVGINIDKGTELINNTTTGKNILLREIGVQEPMRSKIVEAPHVTEDYLEAHISQWKQERGVGVGVLINRLRENMPAPKQSDYVNNDYSDFIEH